jgi:hypothetical protein
MRHHPAQAPTNSGTSLGERDVVAYVVAQGAVCKVITLQSSQPSGR